MKKIIFASAATLLISMFAGCSAADDSEISAPRSNVTKIPVDANTKTGISEFCDTYSTVSSDEDFSIYRCDNGKFYGCDERCQEMSEEDVENFLDLE